MTSRGQDPAGTDDHGESEPVSPAPGASAPDTTALGAADQEADVASRCATTSTRAEERRARAALALLAEPGDPRLVSLLSEYGAVEVVRAAVRGASVIPQPWRGRTAGLSSRVDDVRRTARAAGIRWVCPGDADWPSQLDDLDEVEGIAGVTGRPLGLWIRGSGRLIELTQRAAAIVGARNATSYGCDVAGELAADLADAGTTVVSGAAFGIDAAAHRGALAMDGPTIAVLACGVDIDYPRAHAGLLERIVQTGLVVSEQPPGTTPTKGRFLTRNRLIAALAQGTVVVEAARRSGALNTLGWANELGRVTLGVPGPVTNQSSIGVNQAIRHGRAVLVTNGAEVLEDLDELGRRDATPPSAPATVWDGLGTIARTVLEALPAHGPRTTGEIAWQTGEDEHDVAEVLRVLAQGGFVRSTPEGWHLGRRADLALAADEQA